MLDVVDNNAAYYYHFDGLGSVVALSDSDADTVQTYEYSVYGQVAASEPEFLANPYMFTGRRFDLETGLYYYRARYYNPHIGRFMQTDPVGYGAGMNCYAYCGNNPLSRLDPMGLAWNYYNYTFPYDVFTDALSDDPYMVMHNYLWHGGFFHEGGDYKGWELDSASLDDDNENYHFTLKYWTEDNEPAPQEPNFELIWWDIKDDGEYIYTIPVLTVDDIGILDDRTLKRVVGPTIHRINQWERPLLYCTPYAPWRWDEMIDKLTLLNTPFHGSPINSWRYEGSVYDDSYINYIAQGHAMRHLKVPYLDGLSLVWCHKKTIDSEVTWGIFYWWNKGWLGYGSRDDW